MAAGLSGQVVIVGASMAGLLAARALADHAASVVVLEREWLPDAVEPRGRVPQGETPAPSPVGGAGPVA